MSTDNFIDELFPKPSKQGLQYIFTLLRVNGIEQYDIDPLFVFKSQVTGGQISRSTIENSKIFWSLVTNLSLIEGGYGYNVDVFWSAATSNYLKEAGKLVKIDFGTYLNNLFTDGQTEVTQDQVDFIKKFFDKYEDTLKSFKNDYPYFKLPNFEVLELLTERGKLNGFRVHFSNGTHAKFCRTNHGTEAINIMFEHNGSVSFMVGDLGALKKQWKVGDKPLYEIGLPGRYNKLGEWMPLIYSGDSDELKKKALDEVEEERIQGILFYVYCTNHWVIEFVAKMSIELPKEYTRLPGDIHLHRVKNENKHEFINDYLYDGTLFLKDITVETIKNGLDSIQHAMDGIAFTFDNTVKWQVKYLIHDHQKGAALPTLKDLTVLRKVLKKTQELNNITIDTAISWYKLGQLTDNKLNAFLCFHIAIEGLAVKLANGELPQSAFYNLYQENNTARDTRIKQIFDEYYKNYYTTDLRKLINDSYFDCMGSITSNMKRAFSAVFGEKNSVIGEYFSGNKSLNSIRGQLAHGEYSEWHYQEYIEVWEKLPRIQEISKAFITRIILQIPAGTKRPSWHRTQRLAVTMFNPKGTLVASKLDMFPNKDWKIKPEWVD